MRLPQSTSTSKPKAFGTRTGNAGGNNANYLDRPLGGQVATLVMAVRLALATVFAAASIGKLLTAQGTDLLLETFQLSPRLRPAVNALPALELAVAGTLVFPQTSR